MTYEDPLDRHNAWWPHKDERLVPLETVSQPANRGPRRFKYPFNELAVGQSFRTEGGNRRTMTNIANKHRWKHGWRFRVRKFQNGLRVTRIE